MKNIRTLWCLITLLCFAAPAVHACDVCGCGSGGSYNGILPNFRNSFIGMRFYYRSFHSTHIGGILLPDTLQEKSREQYFTLDIWARYTLNSRYMFGILVPVNYAVQKEANALYTGQGVGDMQLSFGAIAWDNFDTVPGKANHNISFFGGLKLPTGNFRQRQDTTLLHPQIQPGTGSWDFWAQGIYTFRKRLWGFSTDFTYRRNNFNPDHYKAGDRFTHNFKAFYWRVVHSVTLLPSAGYTVDYALDDFYDGIREPVSGGFLSTGNISMDIYFPKFSVGVTGQIPMYHNLADGHVKPYPRVWAHLVIFLN